MCNDRPSSESYEFAYDVSAREETDQPSFADDGDTLDVFVAHQRRHFGGGLLWRDTQHLTRHHVTHGFSPLRRRRRKACTVREDFGCEQMPHQLALTQHAEEPVVVVDDGK